MKRKGEKCHFCEHDCSPRTSKPEVCARCKQFSNFKAKTRMTDFEMHRYAKLVEEEEWINDTSIEFDRDTALAVLEAISKHMYLGHDRFGDPTLVINRYRFDAVKRKFLDRKKTIKKT